jgi:hypothetical protein
MANVMMLKLKCEGLKKLDMLSESDPFARVLMAGSNGESYELARTETIMNNQDPDWSTLLKLDYHPGHGQRLKLEVYDEDFQEIHRLINAKDVKYHQLQGECWIDLDALLVANDMSITEVRVQG